MVKCLLIVVFSYDDHGGGPCHLLLRRLDPLTPQLQKVNNHNNDVFIMYVSHCARFPICHFTLRGRVSSGVGSEVFHVKGHIRRSL